jgi:hypothetical protein
MRWNWRAGGRSVVRVLVQDELRKGLGAARKRQRQRQRLWMMLMLMLMPMPMMRGTRNA